MTTGVGISVDELRDLRARGESVTILDIRPSNERVEWLIPGSQHRRELNAGSLADDMEAWSVAWNAAPIAVQRSGAQVIQVRRTGKGYLSYVVDAAGKATIIDAFQRGRVCVLRDVADSAGRSQPLSNYESQRIRRAATA
jgi:rhodanese-related sulfurtransferase